MISICIPVYNFDCSALILSLTKQITDNQLAAEIVLIDDASEENFRAIHSSIPQIKYIQLAQNVGRARIRNLFLQHTQFPYLLFLDCDGAVNHPNFIKNYLQSISPNFKGVICGGRVYPNFVHESKKLHWKYGVNFESKSAFERSKKPYGSFMTNNFLIEKSILQQFPFNENLVQYGHEDTLLGIQLQQNNIPIIHIANEILNLDIETNESYLQKTQLAVQNLAYLMQNPSYQKAIIQHVKMAKIGYFLYRYKIIHFVRFFNPILLPISYLIAKKSSSTFTLNIFKLLFWVKCIPKNALKLTRPKKVYT
jgi:glycosyltransferase involved in cell wall biosynthesis